MAEPADMRQAWEVFVREERLLPSVDSLIARSWLRCAPRLNPRQEPKIKRLSQEHLLAAQVASFPLLSIARPVMEDIHQYVEGSEVALVFANSAGYILDACGDPAMTECLRAFGMESGVTVSEQELGTNPLALAIRERVPVSVRGAEHFLERFHDLAGAAAPIFDPYGRPLGALGALTHARAAHPHTLGLVVAGARAMEGQRQSDLLLQEHNNQLAELNAILGTISEGILVWNADGVLMHVNASAAQTLQTPASSLVGRQLAERLSLPAVLETAIANARTLTDVEGTLELEGRDINAVFSLRFVENDQGIRWGILTLREAEKVRQMIQYQVGEQSSVSIDDFVGKSPQSRRLRRQAKTAAPAGAAILIRGETGTGKDYMARALHNASHRRGRPFFVFGCSSVPNELVLQELLGVEESRAPEQTGGRPSKFELAHRGTLFFQDVEALPLEAQAVLLNVSELGILHRLGSTRPVEVDVRILASTSLSLEARVSEGQFRADLFYRLTPFELYLPPLRERVEDIPFYVRRIIRRLSRQHRRSLTLAEGVTDLLAKYPWPGNTRELGAVLERAAIQAGESAVIGPMHLPDYIRRPAIRKVEGERPVTLPSLADVERQALLQAARHCQGNVSEMARVLGISRTTVWRKLQKLNISADHFRQTRRAG